MYKYGLYFFLLLTSFYTSANIYKASDAINDKRYDDAKTYLKQSAQIGNAKAQFLLGILHYEGKSGKIDKNLAISWLFLASEYNYPNAIEYAGQIYQELSPEEQKAATKISGQVRAKYGKATLQKNIYPTIHQEEIEDQIITKPSKILERGELHYKRGLAGAMNSMMINNAINRRDRNALNNLDKTLINDDSGKVIIKYNVALDGRSRSSEVLFSWPQGRFDEPSLSSIYTSKFTTAKNESTEKEQYGLVAPNYFGIYGVVSLRDDYPHIYKRFKNLKNRVDEGPQVKYLYASFLRAYQDYLSESEAQAFDVVLLEAAEGDYTPAQVSYAEYQIYENNDLEAGLPWLIKAAKDGFAPAEYRLGELTYYPPSPYLKKDAKKSIFWLTSAAEQGNKKAQLKLIEILNKENKLSLDYAKKAISWLEEIADNKQENPNVYYLLAVAYNIIDDKDEAEDYIETAIDMAEDYKWDISRWLTFKNELAKKS